MKINIIYCFNYSFIFIFDSQVITAYTLAKITSFNITLYYILRSHSVYKTCSFYSESHHSTKEVIISDLIGWGDRIFDDFWP